MPHLSIQYSPQLAQRHDMAGLCKQLREVMIDQGCFPVGGIRVRAWPTPAEALADGHPNNCYADMILRMGTGRTTEAKQAAGAALMAGVEAFFASELKAGHMMLALEIVEINGEMSWKTNTVHARLGGTL